MSAARRAPIFEAMRRSLPIALVFLGALLVLIAYGLVFADAPSPAQWVLAFGVVLVLTGFGLLGAGRDAPRLQAAVLVACALTFVGFAYALAQPTPVPGAALWLGLPPATTVLLILAGAVPMLLLPIAYAWAFPREVHREP